jgi:hypothetical protein
MNKFAAQIEQDMDFLMSGDVKKSISFDNATLYLKKASNLLRNAGLIVESKQIDNIIIKKERVII